MHDLWKQLDGEVSEDSHGEATAREGIAPGKVTLTQGINCIAQAGGERRTVRGSSRSPARSAGATAADPFDFSFGAGGTVEGAPGERTRTEMAFPHGSLIQSMLGTSIPGSAVYDPSACEERGVPAFTDGGITSTGAA